MYFQYRIIQDGSLLLNMDKSCHLTISVVLSLSKIGRKRVGIRCTWQQEEQ